MNHLDQVLQEVDNKQTDCSLLDAHISVTKNHCQKYQLIINIFIHELYQLPCMGNWCMAIFAIHFYIPSQVGLVSNIFQQTQCLFCPVRSIYSNNP